MVVGNHQCNAANLNLSESQFQLELSLAQFSPSLFVKLRLGVLIPRSVCLSVCLSVGPSSKNYKKLQNFTKPLKTLQNIRK